MKALEGERIRVRGLVQGVGFRPAVWRLARNLELAGDVRNDGEGVLIRIWAERELIDEFCRRLRRECPPLARIDSLERSPLQTELGDGPTPRGFSIGSSETTGVRTGVVPDAATCPDCLAEIRDPGNRRWRYPFANCTHCGPRLSIIRAVPYDRCNTSMAAFPMCEACQAEYLDPADRRFHAQPNACPVCGPRTWLVDAEGDEIDPARLEASDAVAAASLLLRQGKILAIKGIGGFHLACDATDGDAVGELRRRKRRYRKPFALMARDLGVIGRFCWVDEREAELLASPPAPILLLETTGPEQVAADVAPGQTTLGFALPYSPLHHLLLQDWERPLVMTSGNLSEEPQCIGNDDARRHLSGLADYYLLHDREILNRVDDSVLRIMDGSPRFLRRARGYAPASIRLAAGFDGGSIGNASESILALGGELKNSICLLADGQAIVSQHLGDLAEARTAAEYERTIALYRALFEHDPSVLAVDLHPDYRSSQLGRAWAAREGLGLIEVQHHFGHIASVLADNAWPLDAGPVLGIALDGVGYGADGTVWGGELLLVDYRGFDRLGYLKPIPLLGGNKAALEPWRNTYAQLVSHFGWEAVRRRYRDLELIDYLHGKPRNVLDAMLERGINSPLSSSTGRLFDAVAAALGICREGLGYEGQAAIELEALAVRAGAARQAYPFGLAGEAYPLVLDPKPMWSALLGDLARGERREAIAARFHAGLADALVRAALRLAPRHGIETVALSGGVFQNKTLLERVSERLRGEGFGVLFHRQVPANDGGIALGQAAIAAAAISTRGRGSPAPSRSGRGLGWGDDHGRGDVSSSGVPRLAP